MQKSKVVFRSPFSFCILDTIYKLHNITLSENLQEFVFDKTEYLKISLLLFFCMLNYACVVSNNQKNYERGKSLT